MLSVSPPLDVRTCGLRFLYPRVFEGPQREHRIGAPKNHLWQLIRTPRPQIMRTTFFKWIFDRLWLVSRYVLGYTPASLGSGVFPQRIP